MCDNCKKEPEERPFCGEVKICEENCEQPPIVQQNTDDVFFGICSQDSLPNLNLKAGTDLSSILKKIDYKLGSNFNTVNFNSFNMSYLTNKYDVSNVKKFAESVSLEFGYDNARINKIISTTNQQGISLGGLTNKVEDIRIPEIVDTASIGFTINDDINTVLQKVVDKFNYVGTGNTTTVSVVDTPTLDLTLMGNSIKGNVRISTVPNNKIQIFGDGLYVNNQTTNTNQTLGINGNQLSISNGNTVSLPILGLQTLNINGNNLTISGGNTISLPSLVETPLTANNSSSLNFTQSGTSGHTLTANIKISSNSGNKIVVNSDGIYVAMDATDVLNQISVNNILKSTLCSLVSNCSSSQCFKWHIQNTSGSSASVSYVDINNVSQSILIGAGISQSVSGLKVLTNPSSTLVITFQGIC